MHEIKTLRTARSNKQLHNYNLRVKYFSQYLIEQVDRNQNIEVLNNSFK